MSRKTTEWTWFRERKCAKCGKVFIAAPEHIFRDKNKNKWYCTWSCFNHKDDKKERAKQ